MCCAPLALVAKRAPPPPPRAGRALAFAWRAIVAAGATACGARTPLEIAGDAEVIVADAGPADAARDAGVDAPPFVPECPIDSGMDAEVCKIPIYGAPPLPEPLELPPAIAPPPPPRVRRRRV
jgi:hypothetical protein